MSYKVLLLGPSVGCISYYFRYLPLRLGVDNVRPAKHGAIDILPDTISIASICTLLMVSTMLEVMHDARRFVPTLVELIILDASFYKTCSITVPALLSTLGYGLAWKTLAGLQIRAIILEE